MMSFLSQANPHMSDHYDTNQEDYELISKITLRLLNNGIGKITAKDQKTTTVFLGCRFPSEVVENQIFPLLEKSKLRRLS